ncbi:MAG: ribonuclease HII [Pseudomonadota bacterium]
MPMDAMVIEQGSAAACGVDEAGRGPWAGPVVVAAAVIDPLDPIDGLDDSKRLKAAERARLCDLILARADVCVVAVSARRIDAMNIRAATLWGMMRAVQGLSHRPSLALIDGRDVPDGLGLAGRAIVGGDAKVPAISAASIVAKVTRDRLMTRLAATFPDYGFERHKGYGTAQHAQALAAHGPTIHHRMTFAPVRRAAAAASRQRVAPKN